MDESAETSYVVEGARFVAAVSIHVLYLRQRWECVVSRFGHDVRMACCVAYGQQEARLPQVACWLPSILHNSPAEAGQAVETTSTFAMYAAICRVVGAVFLADAASAYALHEMFAQLMFEYIIVSLIDGGELSPIALAALRPFGAQCYSGQQALLAAAASPCYWSSRSPASCFGCMCICCVGDDQHTLPELNSLWTGSAAEYLMCVQVSLPGHKH